MGLKLKLKPKESIYISGALVRNGGSGVVLELINEVPMLREKDILLESNARTPCQKLYLIVQTLYLDESSRGTLLATFESLLSEIATAAPSLRVILKSAMQRVLACEYYLALKELQKVIELEKKLIKHA
jgi:flagellar protein FlbT